MKLRIWTTLFLLGFAQSFWRQTTATPIGGVSSQTTIDAGAGVPIELTRRFGLVLVRVEVNGRPATLIMDTGSSHTILSTKFVQVRALALGDVARPSKGSGWVGSAAWIKATLKVGEVAWPDRELLVMDDLPDISNAVGQKIDGILGEDVLKEFAAVEIDFKHRRLVLMH